jgi:hypothetical protein
LHQLAQLIFLFQGSWAGKSVQLTSWFDAIRISLIFAPGMELIFCFFHRNSSALSRAFSVIIKCFTACDWIISAVN